MQDVRFAVRLLIKDRWFTAATVLVLALGIGANTIVFTIINGWNLQQLPVQDGDRIVHVSTRDARGRERPALYRDFLEWQKVARTFSGLAAMSATSMTVAAEGRPAERLGGTFVSANAFGVLRERPILGRDFQPEDDHAGAEPVAIIAHSVWTGRFGSDPSVVGQTIRVDGRSATVIGVMPEGFGFPERTEIWQPMAQRRGEEPRETRTVGVFGRLADTVTLAEANAELSTVTAALAKQFPAADRAVQANVVPFTKHFFGSLTEGPPLILMVAVGVVLLIACANAANLLLARGAYRTREISLRRALGASRWRIVRQLLVESLILAALAGVCGLLLAWPIVQVVAAETADFNLPYWARLRFDARVFGFIAGACVGTALLCGLAPALRLSGAHAAATLAEAGRTMHGGPRARRLTGALLVAELALSVILLSSAGLLIRSARALYDADRLVDSSNVLIARLTLPAEKYATPRERIAFYDRLEEQLRTIPAIESASIGTELPFLGSRGRDVVLDDDARSQPRRVATLAIGARYHETLGLAIQRGRPLSADDGPPGREAALVNDRFVAVHLAGADPIGRRIRFSIPEDSTAGPSRFTIVGVVPSIRHSPTRGPQPAVYLPLRAEPPDDIALLVRGRSDSDAVAPLLREALRRLDPDLPLYRVSTLERRSQQSRWTHRAMSALLGLFATMAMLLSAMGLYAVTAYAVSQRTSEIGIRMALGAQRGQVSWLFVRETLVRLAVGLTLGIAGAAAAGELLQGILVQTNPLDPATFAAVITLLASVAMLACLVPARRAAAIDPAIALRRD